MSSACSRALVLFLVISIAMLGRFLGLAAINCLAKVTFLASVEGAWSSSFSTLSEKTCARERMVGSSVEGCFVKSTKWQKGLGSSRVLRKAF